LKKEGMMEKEEKKGTSYSTGNCKLTYALNAEGNLVHIDTVPNGDACGCFCPKCKEPLIARNGGTKKQPHFAHKPDSTCQGADETTLHMLAKEIINEEKMMKLPKYEKLRQYDTYNDYNKGEDFGIFYDHGPYVEMNPYIIQFDKIEIEKRNDSNVLQPDCVGITKKGKRLAIEICVTHPVDDVKKEKFKQLGLDCVEIIIPRNFPMEKDELRDLIINETSCKRWINCPSGDTYLIKKEIEQQEERFIKFRNDHPECTVVLKENCDNCSLFIKVLEMRWNELVKTHKNRLHVWAKPLTNKTFNDIVRLNIRMRGNNWDSQYVWIDRQKRYLYPKNDKFEYYQHKYICSSTFGFFKTMEEIVDKYIYYLKSHKVCDNCCAIINYNGIKYVFCSKKDIKE
jgi:hypothetical protein